LDVGGWHRLPDLEGDGAGTRKAEVEAPAAGRLERQLHRAPAVTLERDGERFRDGERRFLPPERLRPEGDANLAPGAGPQGPAGARAVGDEALAAAGQRRSERSRRSGAGVGDPEGRGGAGADLDPAERVVDFRDGELRHVSRWQWPGPGPGVVHDRDDAVAGVAGGRGDENEGDADGCERKALHGSPPNPDEKVRVTRRLRNDAARLVRQDEPF